MEFEVRFKDGRTVRYSRAFLDKVLYAITSLELTPLIHELGIEAIADCDGQILWPSSRIRVPTSDENQ